MEVRPQGRHTAAALRRLTQAIVAVHHPPIVVDEAEAVEVAVGVIRHIQVTAAVPIAEVTVVETSVPPKENATALFRRHGRNHQKIEKSVENKTSHREKLKGNRLMSMLTRSHFVMNVNLQVLNQETTQGNQIVLDRDLTLIPGRRLDRQREPLNPDQEIVQNLPKKHGVNKRQKAALDQHPVVEAFQDPGQIHLGQGLYLDRLQDLDHGVVDGRNLDQDPGPDQFPDPGLDQDHVLILVHVQDLDQFPDLLMEKGKFRIKQDEIRGPDQENLQQKGNEAIPVGDAVGHRLTRGARHLHVLDRILLDRILAVVLIPGNSKFALSK